MTQALAISSGKIDKANTIAIWFEKFNCLLKQIFEDESVELVFDEDTFKFSIIMDGREPFDFNTLSSGYAAILDIVVDLIIRMEKQLNRTFDFNIPGVVLIDEIETHLHLELQKNIMNLLTTIFPNVQFIVSSHSPFVLNSLDNVVIYDLEKKVLVENQKEYIEYLYQIIYVFLTIFLYLLKCPQSLILSALRAFCFCGKPHISRSIFLYFRYQAWLKSW